jgi:hypothetical protein
MGFKNKFDAGELDKWCLGAIDDPAYQRGGGLAGKFYAYAGWRDKPVQGV